MRTAPARSRLRAGCDARRPMLLSGFTTTWREKRRSTDSTLPALARHCGDVVEQQAIFVDEIGVAEMHLRMGAWSSPGSSPVSVARTSWASVRSTSLTWSLAPGAQVQYPSEFVT
jgi:hypothetical protein